MVIAGGDRQIELIKKAKSKKINKNQVFCIKQVGWEIDKSRGLIKDDRVNLEKQFVNQRIKGYRDVYISMDYNTVRTQMFRCMDCGILRVAYIVT